MFIDASALTAIVRQEPGFEPLAQALERASERWISPLAFWETARALTRLRTIEVDDAGQWLRNVLASLDITLVPIPVEASELAVDAHARYGKGRHRAALNMGDCFAYAMAKHLGVPLLYKGDDFAQTDLA